MAHGQAVVGVVGAAHVPGIANHWANAGHPESAHLTTLYLEPPPEFNPVLNLFPTLIFGARKGSDMQLQMLVDFTLQGCPEVQLSVRLEVASCKP